MSLHAAQQLFELVTRAAQKIHPHTRRSHEKNSGESLNLSQLIFNSIIAFREQWYNLSRSWLGTKEAAVCFVGCLKSKQLESARFRSLKMLINFRFLNCSIIECLNYAFKDDLTRTREPACIFSLCNSERRFHHPPAPAFDGSHLVTLRAPHFILPFFCVLHRRNWLRNKNKASCTISIIIFPRANIIYYILHVFFLSSSSSAEARRKQRKKNSI